MKKLGRSHIEFKDRQLNTSKDNGAWFDDFFAPEIEKEAAEVNGADQQGEKNSLLAISKAISEEHTKPIEAKMKDIRERVGLTRFQELNKVANDEESGVLKSKPHIKDYIDYKLDDRGGHIDKVALMDELRELFGVDIKDNNVLGYISDKSEKYPKEEDPDHVCPAHPEKLDSESFKQENEQTWGENKDTNLM